MSAACTAASVSRKGSEKSDGSSLRYTWWRYGQVQTRQGVDELEQSAEGGVAGCVMRGWAMLNPERAAARAAARQKPSAHFKSIINAENQDPQGSAERHVIWPPALLINS